VIKVAEGREVVEIVGEVTALAVQHFGRSVGDPDVFLVGIDDTLRLGFRFFATLFAGIHVLSTVFDRIWRPSEGRAVDSGRALE
jgi:hypothetical protein